MPPKRSQNVDALVKGQQAGVPVVKGMPIDPNMFPVSRPGQDAPPPRPAKPSGPLPPNTVKPLPIRPPVNPDGVIPQLQRIPPPQELGGKRAPAYGMSVEDIARVCHECNRAYSIALGDRSHPVWEQASQHHKQSMMVGVEALMSGSIRNPREAHESWMLQKLKSGWTYGEEHNPESKTHPLLVPYSALEDKFKLKDYLFTGMVVLLTEPA